jgi:hypothetical protein
MADFRPIASSARSERCRGGIAVTCLGEIESRVRAAELISDVSFGVDRQPGPVGRLTKSRPNAGFSVHLQS